MNKELVKCPRCSNLVKPIRKANRQSMWHKAFIPFAAYYGAFVWECPVCGYRLPKDEGRDVNKKYEWIDDKKAWIDEIMAEDGILPDEEMEKDSVTNERNERERIRGEKQSEENRL